RRALTVGSCRGGGRRRTRTRGDQRRGSGGSGPRGAQPPGDRHPVSARDAEVAVSLRIPGYLGTFWELLGDHLVMALGASLLGLVLALPLGLACVRWPRVYAPVLAACSVLYSIPSLAFFVLLIAFTG